MKNYYLLVIICLGFFQSYAQENNFYIKERFFEGQKVKMFSENRGGAVVVLDDNSIHLMSKDFQFTDVSDLFDANILEDISCIEVVNDRIFLLGTKGNSLFMYDEGEIIRMKDMNPDLPVQVNSIDYRSGSYDEKLLVATNDSLWVSNDLKFYERSDSELSANPKFYGGRTATLIESEDYYGCYEISSEYSILYSSRGNSLIFKIFQNENFDIDKLYDIEFGRYTGYSGFYGLFAFYAAHNGIYAQSIGECNFDTAVHITDVAVHDLEVIQYQGLNRDAMLAASDTGLFFSEVNEYDDFDVYNNYKYHSVAGIDSAYTLNYSIFHNTIWVGTNNGLLQVHDDNLTSDLVEPDSIEYDTIYYCQDQGAYLSVAIHDQIDKQWFKNGEKIDGAISRIYAAQEEALYSIQYNFEDSLYYYDVARTQLENRFNETIRKQEYLICPDDYGVSVYVDDSDYNSHDYSWYSVERGLEFETATSTNNYFHTFEAGNYYFIATNCNGFTYHSDTVEVNRSSLGDETFSMILDQDLCVGDTVFVQNSETGIEFEWDISYTDLEGYDEPYIVLKEEYSGYNLALRMIDQFGCTNTLYAIIDDVNPLPTLNEGQEEIYICEREDFVYFDLEQGLTASWDGILDGVDQKVGPGIYPVTISNGVCPDYNVDVEIKYFDPFPILNFQDTVLQVGDTFKIPTYGYVGVNWEGEVQISSDQSYFYLTSNVADTLHTELWFESADCEQSYPFTIIFDGPPVLSVDSHELSLQIYPNPSKNAVRIDQKQANITSIQLLTLTGKILDIQNYQDASSVLFDYPLSLQGGTYLLRIKSNNDQEVIRKIIIKD